MNTNGRFLKDNALTPEGVAILSVITQAWNERARKRYAEGQTEIYPKDSTPGETLDRILIQAAAAFTDTDIYERYIEALEKEGQ